MRNVLLVLVLLVAAVLAGWYLLGGEVVRNDPAVIETPVEEAVGREQDRLPADEVEALPAFVEPAPAMEPEPGWVLPALNQSDVFVREQLLALGMPESWVAQEELVRRMATVLENAARGEYPRRQLAVVPLVGTFQVIERDGRLFVDPANYARPVPVLDVLEAVPPPALARLIRFLLPLLDEALRELGASGTAEERVVAAVDQVLAVPVLVGDVELERPNVFYIYADPALEALKPLQKLMLRAGPENVLRIQAYLREIAGALGVNPRA